MQIIQWLQSQMLFLQTDLFSFIYGLIVFLNPIAIAPQLISSVKAKPEELRGVSVVMFIVFLTIQLTLALGSIKNLDLSLFGSMVISSLITSTVIVVTVIRRGE